MQVNAANAPSRSARPRSIDLMQGGSGAAPRSEMGAFYKLNR
jgi:hypothetical protein